MLTETVATSHQRHEQIGLVEGGLVLWQNSYVRLAVLTDSLCALIAERSLSESGSRVRTTGQWRI
jgi:hypothetical protein